MRLHQITNKILSVFLTFALLINSIAVYSPLIFYPQTVEAQSEDQTDQNIKTNLSFLSASNSFLISTQTKKDISYVLSYRHNDKTEGIVGQGSPVNDVFSAEHYAGTCSEKCTPHDPIRALVKLHSDQGNGDTVYISIENGVSTERYRYTSKTTEVSNEDTQFLEEGIVPNTIDMTPTLTPTPTDLVPVPTPINLNLTELLTSQMTIVSVLPDCVNDSAGANDEPGQKDLTRLCRDISQIDPFDINWNWDVISMSGNNSADGCALFDINNNGLADYSMCVTWKTNQQQIAGSPQLYSCTDTRSDRCSGSILVTNTLLSSCTVGNATDDPFPADDSYPNDTKASCTIYLNDVGGPTKASLLDVCSYPSEQPNSDPSDCIIIQDNNGILTINKDVDPDDIATNWNFAITGNQSGNYSISGDGTTGILSYPYGTYTITETAGSNTDLSKYSTNWVCTKNGLGYLSGSGTVASNIEVTKSGSVPDSIVCTFENKLNQSTLLVKKHVINDNGGVKTASDFTINVTGTNVSPSTFPGNESGTTVKLAPGSYSVDEIELAGYAKTIGVNCSGTLLPGESKTCTLTNDDNQSYIIVDKTVVNDNGGSANPDDFKLTVDGNAVLDGVAYPVIPGTHTAGETNLSGYTQGVWGTDCNRDGSVTVALGETKTCTITNNDQQAYITVVKTVTNDNGGSAKPDDFKLTLEGNPVLSGVAVAVNPGIYTAGETLVSGYTFGGYLGDCDKNGDITVALGESKTCTLTNDDAEPSLTLIKEVITDDGGSQSASVWTLTANGPTGFSGKGPSVSSSSSFDAGTYDLSESGPDGYTAGAWLCKGGNQTDSDTVIVNLGDSVVCTIINDDIAPTLTLIKKVINDNGGNAQISDFLLKANGVQFTSGTAQNVKVGTYTLSEESFFGYVASDWVCTGTGTQNGSDITLAEGQSATCTITNDDQQGTLIVKKVVINDNGGTLQAEDFTFSVNSGILIPFEADGQNDLMVDAGMYSVTEPSVTGYTTTYTECTGMGVGSGETVTCTITNDDIQPQLTVTKIVASGSAQVSNFDLYVNQTQVQSGVTNGFNAGLYTISEINNTGYGYTGIIECDGNLADTVTLNIGDNKACTITNTRDQGTLKVNKQVDTDGDGTYEGGNAEGNTLGFTWGLESALYPYQMGESLVLDTNSYEVYENSVNNYHYTGWYYTNQTAYTCENPQGTSFPVSITAEKGLITEITLCNARDMGYVEVLKYHDKDANGLQDYDEEGMENWNIILGTLNQTTNSSGTTIFTVPTGNYNLTETLKENWYLSTISCGDANSTSLDGLNINITKDQTLYCKIGNYTKGSVVVTKRVWDQYGNDIDDTSTKFDFTLANESFSLTDNESHQSSLLPGIYAVNETPSDYYDFLGCKLVEPQTDELFSFMRIVQSIYDPNLLITVSSSSTLYIECVNQQQPIPALTISKYNSVWPTSQNKDSIVTYYITIKVTLGKMYNLIVTDLLPSGFSYITGSWSASKNGSPYSIPEPIYASPGKWYLGDLIKGDEVVLIYNAKVGDVKPGTYKDLAYAFGCIRDVDCLIDDNGLAVVASSTDSLRIDPGIIDDTNVGTQVAVNFDQSGSVGAGVEQTETKVGSVLGASTMPATGAHAVWLLLAFGMIGGGILLVKKGRTKYIKN